MQFLECRLFLALHAHLLREDPGVAPMLKLNRSRNGGGRMMSVRPHRPQNDPQPSGYRNDNPLDKKPPSVKFNAMLAGVSTRLRRIRPSPHLANDAVHVISRPS